MQTKNNGARKVDRVLLRKTAAANIAGNAVGGNVDAAKTMPSLEITQLFDGFREIRLFHDSKEYRLSLTKNNKLILTK